MRLYNDNTVQQTAMGIPPSRDAVQRPLGPVLGVVLFVRYPDDPDNPATARTSDVLSAFATAAVLIVDGHAEARGFLRDVLVLPDALTGPDDYAESYPRGCSAFLDLDGLPSLPNSPTDIPPEKLDGEWAIIDWLGGHIDRPYIQRWYPHQYNRRDACTSGQNGRLDQRGRSWRRIRGTRFFVGPDGTVVLDTVEANSYLQPTAGGPERKRRDDGGDVRIDMKPTRRLDVNFNEAPAARPDMPSWPQPNPAAPGAVPARPDVFTRVSFSKDEIEMVAGSRARFFERGGGLVLGGTPEEYASTPSLWQRVPRGENWFAWANAFVDKFNTLVSAFITHKGHISASPVVPDTAAQALPADQLDEDEDLSERVRTR